jgi:hypothetical protein
MKISRNMAGLHMHVYRVNLNIVWVKDGFIVRVFHQVLIILLSA